LTLEPRALARELLAAYADRQPVPLPPTVREAGFDLGTAYVVEAEVAALRRAGGRRTVGRKVGYANRALWRVFKLESVAWAHMYEDTVRFAAGDASLSLRSMYAPKIEPEIIFKLQRAPAGDPADPVAVLEAVAWMALGFEIVDCVFPDWKFKPADFVASLGLHAGLIVGTPRMIHATMIPELSQRLASAKARLLKDGRPVADGSAANVLGSPALCLGELARGIAGQANAEPLAPGELIATGALTDNQFIAPGESWTAVVEALELPAITVRTTE
jgi:2-oxo-3-hexenedioate decarboxylase